MARAQQHIQNQKNVLFYILLAFLPIFILGLAEVGLRFFHYGGNLDLFITAPEEQISHYWMCNPNLGERYFFKQNTKPAPPKDIFLKEKPENEFRIFAMGGSTTAGFPFGNNLTFPVILNKRLSDIFTNQQITVVNTAMSAVNSYTLYDLMDELIDQDPDALLVYAGHNEFYGALGVSSHETLSKNPQVTYSYLKLRRFRLFLLVRDAIAFLQNSISKINSNNDVVDASNTLMARIVADREIPYQSELYKRGLEQFENNLERICTKAQKHAIPVMLSELVSNIKDQPPFVSVHADSFPPAAEIFTQGLGLVEQGDLSAARSTLLLAKDLDALRFRATEDMNKIIHRVAKKYQYPVVPMIDFFEQYSDDHIIGDDLILEHLHPNAKGYFIMADAFLQTMRENEFIQTNWDTSKIYSWQSYYHNWGITSVDTAAADLTIAYLKGGWPFQEKNINHTLENIQLKTRLDSVALRIVTDPNYSHVVGHVEMAEYYEMNRQYYNAFLEYKAAYYTVPSEIMFYEKAARNLMRLNEYQQAFHVLEKALPYGRSAYINKWMGLFLARQKRYSEAVPFLEKAKLSYPQDVQIYKYLAGCYSKLNDEDKLLKIQNEFASAADSMSLDDDFASGQPDQLVYAALEKKARELLQAKQYADALQVLQKADVLNSTQFTNKWLGLLNLSAGKLDLAVKYLSVVVENDPNDFESKYNLCIAFVQQKDKRHALELLNDMERIRPGFDDPQQLKSKILKM